VGEEAVVLLGVPLEQQRQTSAPSVHGITGKKPFDGHDVGAVFLQQRTMAPPPFSAAAPEVWVSPALETVVRRALEKAPAARFPSAMTMMEALESVPELSSGRAPVERAPVPDATVFERRPFGAEAHPSGDRLRALMGAARKTVVRASSAALWIAHRASSVLHRSLTLARRRPRVSAAILAVGLAAMVALVVLTRASSPAGLQAGTAGGSVVTGTDKLATIDQLVARGERKQAIVQLRDLRKTHPSDADYAAALAELCFQERRYSEAAAAYRATIRFDRKRRDDPVLINHLIDSLRSDPFAPTGEQLLRDLGRSARPQLKAAARSHKNARVRTRAANLLREGVR
jgi:hypothetical protein